MKCTQCDKQLAIYDFTQKYPFNSLFPISICWMEIKQKIFINLYLLASNFHSKINNNKL
jgi:hypothetical protein